METAPGPAQVPAAPGHHLRFHAPHMQLAPVFGTDWFALTEEVHRHIVAKD